MKHEGYIPVTIVSGGDTLTIRKKISGSACLSDVKLQLSAQIGYLYHLAIWKTGSIQLKSFLV